MAMEVGQLYEKLELRDSGFKQKMSNALSMSGKLSTALKVGVAGAALGVGAALGKMAQTGARNIRKVRDAQKRFRQETGASEEQAEEFAGTIRDLHKQNTDSYEELADTVTALRQRFGEASEGMEQDMLDYAKVTKQDGVSAVEELHSVMEAWDVEVSRSSELMDKLMSIHQETGMEVRSLQKGLQDTAPAMKALNIDMDEGIAIMGQFAERGVNATKAQRGFRQMMQRMADPTKQQAESLEMLGIQVQETEEGFRVGEGALETFMARLDEGDLTAEEMAAAMDILGRRSGEKIVQAMKNGEAGINSLMGVIENSKGTVQEASKVYDKQLGERWTLIKRQYLEPFMETMGVGLINVLEKTLGAIEQWAPMISKGFAVVGDVVGNIFGAGGDIRESFGGLYDDINSVFAEIMKTFEAFWNFTRPFWEAIATSITDAWDYAWGVIYAIVDTTIGSVEGLMEFWRGVFTGDFDLIKKGVLDIWQSLWEGAHDIFFKVLGFLSDLGQNFAKGIIGLFDNMGVDIVQVVAGFLRGMRENFIKALNNITGMVGDFAAEVIERFKWMHRVVPGLTKEMFEGAKEDMREWKAVSSDLGLETTETFIENMRLFKEGGKEQVTLTRQKITEELNKIRNNTKVKSSQTEKAHTENVKKGKKQRLEQYKQDKLNRLNELKKSGQLSEKEYKKQKENLSQITSKTSDEIIGNVRETKNKSQKEAQEMTTSLSDIFGDFKVGTKETFSGLGEDLRGVMNSIADDVSEKFSQILSDMISGSKSIEQGIKDIGQTIMGSVVDRGGNWLADKASSWIGSALGTAVGGPVGGFLGKIGGDVAGDLIGAGADWLGNIFGLASGGLATDPLLSVIGEGRHDEAVLPLNSMTFGRLAKGITDKISMDATKQIVKKGTEKAEIIVQLDSETIARGVADPLAKRVLIKGGLG